MLKTVVDEVEDSSSQISVEEARWEDPDFQPGDVLEEEVPFEAFGRMAVQAAKQRIIQRVREGERSRIRDEFDGQGWRAGLGRGPADRAWETRRPDQQIP